MTCMTVIARPTWTTPVSPERSSHLQSQFPDVVCAYTTFLAPATIIIVAEIENVILTR